MISKWLEDMTDNLWYLAALLGLLFFFCIHWREEYQIRYAELVMEEFLTAVSATGTITLENYESLIKNLDRAVPGYEVEMVYTEYIQQPVYAPISRTELEQYYMGRNVKNTEAILPYEVKVEENGAEALSLQTETNTTILSAEQMEFLPLPENGTAISVEAVRPRQEVYEGEKLITLCKVYSLEGSYYMAAEEVYAGASGTVLLNLVINGNVYNAQVEVLCHPRWILCRNGHELVNSKMVLEKTKATGQIWCPYCLVLPENVICNTAFLRKQTGKELTGEELWLVVNFLDGHTEIITPEAEDWQDDYDKIFCGMQTVTVSFRGMETVVTVMSENEPCVKCTRSCNERSFTDYKEFPYCTSCMSQVPLFTGTVKEEEQLTKGEQIVAALDKEGVYHLTSGANMTLYLYKEEECRSALQCQIRTDGKGG